MNKNNTTNTTRLAPGYYALITGAGYLDRYEVNFINDLWLLTYPGEQRADDVYATLSDAREAIVAHLHSI